jgi:hypothetical protein
MEESGMKILALAAIVLLSTSTTARSQEVTFRSYVAKNCPECKEGEKAMTVRQAVGKGDYVHVADPSCGGEFDGKLKDLFRQLAATQIPGIDRYAGPVLDGAAKGAATFIKKHVRGGDIGAAISPWTAPTANCAVVVLSLPVKAKLIGFRLEAESPTPANGYPSNGICQPAIDCPIGWAKWTALPTEAVIGKNESRVISGIFKNWSDNLPRVAKLTVYYKYNGPELR